MNKIIIALAVLFSMGLVDAYTGTVTNNTDQNIKVRLTYHGESGIACKPDEREVLPGSNFTTSTGLCCLRSASVEFVTGKYKGSKVEHGGYFRCGDFNIPVNLGPVFELK